MGNYELINNDEDSTVITQKMSDEMSAKFTSARDVLLDKNSNIINIAKKGDSVRADDPIITFENGFESSEIAAILDKLDSSVQNDIDDLSSKRIFAKHTGEIINIEIFYNADEDEMSSSIKKLVSQYKKETGKKVKAINTALSGSEGKEYSSNVVNGEIHDNRIMGQEIDGILIRFYIEYPVSAAVGDKVTAFTALKATISDVIPSAQAPITESGEEVEMIFSPLSIVSRMTNSIFYDLYINKGLVNLNKQIKEML